MFLYIDPIKQGLKLPYANSISIISGKFLYIDPIKQGLKPEPIDSPDMGFVGFYT